MGADDIFKKHARKVYFMLKDNGVENLITVEPHTTNMLRSVYPTFIDDYDIHVESYLEVLAEKDMEPVNKADTIAFDHKLPPPV